MKPPRINNYKLLDISHPTPIVTITPSELKYMSKETGIEIEKLISVIEYLADKEIVFIRLKNGE
jgi:hypothetical protein